MNKDTKDAIKEWEVKAALIGGRGFTGAYQTIFIDDECTIEGGRHKNVRNNILNNLRFVKDKTVIDFGCNVGGVCIDAKNAGATSVVGVDISQSAIGLAKELVGIVDLDIDYKVIDLDATDEEVFRETVSRDNFDVALLLSIWRHIDIEKFASWVGNVVDSIIVFEGHASMANERNICEDILRRNLTGFSIRYLGEAGNYAKVTTGRPIFICEK